MLQAKAYPSVESAPEELKQLSGPCGPISVWLVLSRHGVKATPEQIIDRCRYEEKLGAFAVCMADAIQHFGLNVQFHTDPDPQPNALELEAYRSLNIAPAASVATLLKSVQNGASVIVSYLALGGESHFSPLVGEKVNKLLLPYSVSGTMLKSEFGKRWRANGILRQSIVAT